MSVPTLDRRYYWTDSYLEQKLQQARDNEDKKRKTRSTKSEMSVGAKLIKYGVMLWAARLGFMGFSSVIPLFGIAMSWLHGPARSGLLTIPVFTLPEISQRLGMTDKPNEVGEGLAEAMRGVFSTPVLIRNVSLPSTKVLLHALLFEVDYKSIKLGNARAHPDSTGPTFSYSDGSVAWADRLHLVNHGGASGYKLTESLENVRGFPFTEGYEGCDLDEPYCHISTSTATPPWHITQHLSPLHVEKLAPALRTFLHNLHSQGAYRLWLGRENVTVLPHYDIEDNWYLQLHGTKTFLMTSAEGFRFFRPHSVLHPSWRQAQRDYLRSVRSLEQAIHEVRILKDYEDTSTTTKSSSGWSAPPVGIWQVTLRPGDLLYLPAYTFHTVTTGHQSASVSVWVPSAASLLYQDLRRMVPLPTTVAATVAAGSSSRAGSDEDNATRLALLGAALGNILGDRLVRGSYTTAFVRRLWTGRHRKAAVDRGGIWCAVASSSTAGQCATTAINRIQNNDSKEPKRKSLLISQTLLTLLQTDSEVKEPAVRLQLLLDWAEEAIHELLQTNGEVSSPCAIMRFIDSCVPW